MNCYFPFQNIDFAFLLRLSRSFNLTQGKEKETPNMVYFTSSGDMKVASQKWWKLCWETRHSPPSRGFSLPIARLSTDSRETRSTPLSSHLSSMKRLPNGFRSEYYISQIEIRSFNSGVTRWFQKRDLCGWKIESWLFYLQYLRALSIHGEDDLWQLRNYPKYHRVQC